MKSTPYPEFNPKVHTSNFCICNSNKSNTMISIYPHISCSQCGKLAGENPYEIESAALKKFDDDIYDIFKNALDK